MENQEKRGNQRNKEIQEKRAVLVISFGTSFRETRERTIDVIEQDIRKAVEGYEFRRAYTSPTIVRILKERDGISVDSVEEALERLLKDGYRKVVAQTTHVIHGFEYDRMRETLTRYRNRFTWRVCGEPLLTDEEDYREAARIMGRELEVFRCSGTDLVLMGHGTEHVANASYARLQQAFFKEGFGDCLVGTVEASPTVENMLALIQARQSKQVVLIPFLVVAGDHACKDMAGDEEESWKTRFLKNGYQVKCVLKGLGEYAGIRQMYVRHAIAARKMAEGALYGIGVGPGDPELLTLKAVRLIKACDVIMAPGMDCRESIAYRIAVQAVPELAGKECVGVELPMTRDQARLRKSHEAAADLVEGYLKRGKIVGFLNLGDVTIYASYLYLHRLIAARGYGTALVNGVPSFCAAAARLGMGLAEGAEELHVLPQPEQIEEGLKLPGTKVIMKMGKNIGQVKERLKESGLRTAMVENCGLPGEQVFSSASEIDEKAGYYSLLIVKGEDWE